MSGLGSVNRRRAKGYPGAGSAADAVYHQFVVMRDAGLPMAQQALDYIAACDQVKQENPKT